jgi:probable phosphomutase (TIGR03848 family)
VTTFLLLRHGATDALGSFISGRMAGVHLNERGRMEASRLAERLGSLPIEAIYSSPLERARETAEPLARRVGRPVHVLEPLSEVDYGDWTGLSFDALHELPQWSHYNRLRSGARIPGGEMLVEVQTRMVTELHRLAEQHPSGLVVVVSHADSIRGLLCWYAGIPIDLFLRFEITTASVSAIRVSDDTVRILCLNNLGDGPLPLE